MMALRTLVALVLLALLAACGDDSNSSTTDPNPTPDAGEDMAEDVDMGGDEDANDDTDADLEPDMDDDPDDGVRKLVSYDPFKDRGNMVYVPDFDMSVFTQKWINVTPAIDARGADMVKEERWPTPSGKTQVLRLPGTAEGPAGNLLLAPSAVADGPTHAEVWVGTAGAHPVEGVSVEMVGVTAEDGQVFAELELAEDTTTEIDGVIWARYETTLPPFVGAAGFYITNNGAGPIKLNGPWVGQR